MAKNYIHLHHTAQVSYSHHSVGDNSCTLCIFALESSSNKVSKGYKEKTDSAEYQDQFPTLQS